MMWQNYQLDDTISKTTEGIRLWQSERGIVEINKGTLAVSIRLNDQQKGYVFHGQGKLLIDAIVETEEGAIGKSVEKELNAPFLMLGSPEEIQKHLTEANDEDLAKMNYEGLQVFVAKAEDLCNRFFQGKMHKHHGFDKDSGIIFAFQNETDKLDILVTKGSKLVYTARDMLFVANKDKVVLKSHGELVCTKNGNALIIKNRKSLIIEK